MNKEILQLLDDCIYATNMYYFAVNDSDIAAGLQITEDKLRSAKKLVEELPQDYDEVAAKLKVTSIALEGANIRLRQVSGLYESCVRLLERR